MSPTTSEDQAPVKTHDRARSVATKINTLLASGDTSGAYGRFRELADLLPRDVTTRLMAGCAAATLGKVEEAERWFSDAAAIDPDDDDIRHNLGALYIQSGQFEKAARVFEETLARGVADSAVRNDLGVAYLELGEHIKARAQFETSLRLDPSSDAARRNLRDVNERLSKAASVPTRIATTQSVLRNERIAVFASSTAFSKDIIEYLAQHNQIRLVGAVDFAQMKSALEWCSLAWFEWCDGLVAAVTRHLPKRVPYILRLHSYEAFTNQPEEVDWDKIDTLILVNESVNVILGDRIPASVRRVIVPNGVDLNKFVLPQRKTYGKRIASVGYINYKKNPQLLLYCFKKIAEWDPEFEFHIVGAFQDPRIELYMRDMAKKLGLNLRYHGWREDMSNLFAEMDFVISTSLFESFHLSIAEGMACGVLPLVHDWFGSENIYPDEMRFRTPDDCLALIQRLMASDRTTLGIACREYISERFSASAQLRAMETAMADGVAGYSAPAQRDYGRVSIVIPTYNRADMLPAAIESALAQTYHNCEVVVVDDGSTDDTQAVLRRYADRIVTVRHAQNKGVSAALNTAIRRATGEYISWLSSDDMYHPDKALEQVAVLGARPELGWVYGDFFYMTPTGQVGDRANVSPLVSEGFVERMFTGNPIHGCSTMFRKSNLEKTGYFDETLGGKIGYGADGAMWHKMGYHFPFAFVTKPLVYYRLHPGQVTHQADIPKHWQEYRSYMEAWLQTQAPPQRASANTITGPRQSDDAERLGIGVDPDFPEEKPGGKRILWLGVMDPCGNAAMYARAINRHTPHLCRVVSFRQTVNFDTDITLRRHKPGEIFERRSLSKTEESRLRDLAERADLIVWSVGTDFQAGQPTTRVDDTDALAWGGLDWREYTRKRECAAFFFGVTAVRRNADWYRDLFASQKRWRMATGQIDLKRRWPEVSYVPTWLDTDAPRYERKITRTDRPLVVQTPSDPSIKNSRELERAVRRLIPQFPELGLVIKSGIPYEEALELKRKGNIGLDQMQRADGYYCMGSLENSALGLANFVYLDEFAINLVRETIGADELPWRIVGNEDELTMGILKLLQDPDELFATQRANYDWMRRHWRPERLVTQLTEGLGL